MLKFLEQNHVKMLLTTCRLYLINRSIFIAPYISKELKLATNTSDVGVGAVLLQEDKDKKNRSAYLLFF